MEHRILAARYIGAAGYLLHLERLCKTETSSWRVTTPNILKLELELNADGFEELQVDDLLMYRQALLVAHDYVRACGDRTFKLEVLSHLEHCRERAKRRADELIRTGSVDKKQFRTLKKVADEIAAISNAMHESAP
jgi:hypothetical protein